MTESRTERSDAARNRVAVLRATEKLLVEHGAEHISLDRVAAQAGVGKGTVFRRFGNRTGLFAALVEERTETLNQDIETGPPPLGPGAAPLPRLRAFLDALADLAARHVSLFAAHEQACGPGRFTSPTYLAWHRHVSGLLAMVRVGDAEATAHALLAAFDADLVRLLCPDGRPDRLAETVKNLATALMSEHPSTVEQVTRSGVADSSSGRA
ncbi:TetR/AcrR family transcriptional regulator [Streptomyces fuscichromogenes]|uniref:TetR family transcriptional regulator n=1 Tax=Streptomyces fuscichromogenes TaxID=1324013 RepID=A0A917XGS1_9ACTN|nr:TetR/AcrR family transcriptional regulator [Streptomyces fuscichromogenes]GGN22982.1 TetR family transcriptional regulator [Streptomyces fuscichromogenes]